MTITHADGLRFLAAVAAVAAVDMTRDEAMAEVKRRRVADPDATWVATQRASEWTVARIGLAPTKQTNTETSHRPWRLATIRILRLNAGHVRRLRLSFHAIRARMAPCLGPTDLRP